MIETARTTKPIVGDLAGLVPSFRRHLRAANRSERTIEVYVSSAEAFAHFLVEQGMPSVAADVHREHVEAYIQHVLERWKPATASVRYRSLQAFWKWALDEGEITANPTARMTPPMIPEEPARVLTDEELRAMLATCDDTLEGRRDEAIIRVFIDSGARLGEVAGLRTADVDLDGGVVRVLGKGRRQRLVGIGARTAKAIDRYLRRRGSSDDLWVGKKGVMTPSGIRQMIWRRSTTAGIGRVHPHVFRHTAAHSWLAAGGSETGLMRKAGWRSRAMLSRYASSTAEARALEESHRLGLGDRL